jgi:manganese efflux pump family protein
MARLSCPAGFIVMGLLSLVVLALSMSADAFAAALSKGSVLNRPHFTEALRIGLLFGTVEAITPVIGWAAGLSAHVYVASLDHWTAFFVLGAVGGKMIWESAKRSEEEARPARDSFAVLLVTAIGTSIDSMAVGVTLAFINANIVVTAAAIGLATFTMATIGIMIGRVAGAAFGRAAEGIGGICLILIGAKILIQHTMFA